MLNVDWCGFGRCLEGEGGGVKPEGKDGVYGRLRKDEEESDVADVGEGFGDGYGYEDGEGVRERLKWDVEVGSDDEAWTGCGSGEAGRANIVGW